MKNRIIIWLLVLFLSACTGKTTPLPVTQTPTVTPTPLPTAAPTITPTSTLLPLNNDPFAGPIPSEALFRLGKGSIWGIHFVDNGNSFVVVTKLGIYFYDTPSFNLINFYNIETAISSYAISPDEKMIAFGYSDGNIEIRELKSNEVITQKFKNDSDEVTSLSFSRDGDTLASATYMNHIVSIWRFADGYGFFLKSFNDQTDRLSSVAFSPDGKVLASASWDGSVIFYDTEKWSILKSIILETYKSQGGYPFRPNVRSIAFSSDGSMIGASLTTLNEDHFSIWLVSTGARILNTTEDFKDTQEGTPGISFSPDNKYFLSGSKDGSITIRDIQTATTIKTLTGHNGLTNTLFTPDGKSLISWSSNGEIYKWDTTNWSITQKIDGFSASIRRIAFSPDGRTLASGLTSNSIMLWNIETKSPYKTLPNSEDILGLAFSPEGKFLASGEWFDKRINLWDIESGEKILVIKDPGIIHDIAYSSSGEMIASCGELSNRVTIWNSVTGDYIVNLNPDVGGIYDVFFSSDDTFIAGAGYHGVDVWDISSGEIIHQFSRYSDSREKIFLSVAISPDDHFFAAGSGDNTITIFDLTKDQVVTVLDDHTDQVWSVVFSPNGKIMASGSWDGTVKIWKVETWELIDTLKGHNDKIFSIAFSPDGRYLVDSSWDGTMVFWDMSKYE